MSATPRTDLERLAIPAACEWGPSGHCERGRHERCAHRPGQPHAAGVTMPDGYLMHRNKYDGLHPTHPLTQHGPWHTWRCPCTCHQEPATDLLELLAIETA